MSNSSVSLYDLRCKCNCPLPMSVMVRLERMAKNLNVIQGAVKTPLKIISGYRCAKRNAAVGGGLESRHVWGDAVEFQVAGKTGKELQEALESLVAFGKIQDGGIATFASRPDSIYYDLRIHPARFKF